MKAACRHDNSLFTKLSAVVLCSLRQERGVCECVFTVLCLYVWHVFYFNVQVSNVSFKPLFDIVPFYTISFSKWHWAHCTKDVYQSGGTGKITSRKKLDISVQPSWLCVVTAGWRHCIATGRNKGVGWRGQTVRGITRKFESYLWKLGTNKQELFIFKLRQSPRFRLEQRPVSWIFPI